MRRPGRARRRWGRRLRRLLFERRFATTQLSFCIAGALAGAWLLWPQDDLRVRQHQELWQRSLHSTSLGEADQVALDRRPSDEEARTSRGVTAARVRGDLLAPAIAAGLTVSAKGRLAGSSAFAEASPQRTRPERVATAGPEVGLSAGALPEVGATPQVVKPQDAPAALAVAPPEVRATSEIEKSQDAPAALAVALPEADATPQVEKPQDAGAALAVALPERVKPLAPDLAEAPEVEVAPEPRTDIAALPVRRPPALPPAQDGTPTWLRNAVPSPPVDDRPVIAVVLDDLGMNRVNTAAINQLEAPLTLAFLPYAGALERQTEAARAAGHELLVHVPMEPIGKEWPGPGALISSLDDQEMLHRLRTQLQSFDGFVGINNHMGSLLTADRRRMAMVMAELRRDGLLFLDSRTSGASVAAAEAHRLGVPHATRDVFLDNDIDAPHIERRLAEVERIARRHDMAVAIGHPHNATIAALRRWLPTLEAKGFALVPISTIVARRACAQGLVADVCGSLHLAAREVEPGVPDKAAKPARFERH
jgi:polysaccharide deacetylase 2 family uncharacterized protein YibQ